MHALRVWSVTALLAVVPVFAQAQTPDTYTPLPSIALPGDLDRVLRGYERAWQAGDEAALAALFTEDGFVPTGHGWVRGHDGIRATYQNASGMLRLRALAFAVQDSVGYIVGAYGYGEGSPVPDTGKFVLALRRSPDGKWLIAADLDQSNRPQ
jgi:ketosteroid isomerase-like protein